RFPMAFDVVGRAKPEEGTLANSGAATSTFGLVLLLGTPDVVRICLADVKLHGTNVELAILALEDTFATNVPAARLVQQFAGPLVDVLNGSVRIDIELARPEP